ncbi:MAG: polymerase, sigma 28 subunit, Sig subfamily [Acidimicrobiales bacterium]|nr:polymerase, sigma 28 subunit, Sig subfamily [Acidimicrobiales bacterium]
MTRATGSSGPNATVAEGSDRSEAARTIPRGGGSVDGDPTPAVDPELWFQHVRYARRRDEQTLVVLVREYEEYALSLARRFHRRGGEPREDLDQVAREALLHALCRFDPGRGLPFPSFASPTISGALRRHFRDRGWGMRVPRRVHELTVASRVTAERLTPLLGREPTPLEVARALGVDVVDLMYAKEAASARQAISLDVEAGPSSVVHDRIGRNDDRLDRVPDLVDLRDAVLDLGERDRRIVAMYYVDQMTQAEIAGHLGVSQMQVSRLLTSTLRRLRHRLRVEAS